VSGTDGPEVRQPEGGFDVHAWDAALVEPAVKSRLVAPLTLPECTPDEWGTAYPLCLAVPTRTALADASAGVRAAQVQEPTNLSIVKVEPCPAAGNG
jgi:hypothetical protein